jgi:hypothetical protein
MNDKKHQRLSSIGALASLYSCPFTAMAVLVILGVPVLSALLIALGLVLEITIVGLAYRLGWRDRQDA